MFQNINLRSRLINHEADFNNNQTQPGLEVTGDDSVDFQREIDALLNTADATGVNQTQQAQGIEIPVMGQTLKFKDPNEAGQKIQEIVQNYQSVVQELQALKQQVPAQTKPVENSNKQGFSNERFSELLQSGTDGVANALNYAMSHMFFDGKVDNAAKTISALLQQSAATSADLTVLRFKDAHPELPRTSEAGQVLENIRNQYNLPFTTQGLEAAYALAKHHNLLQTQQSTPQAPPSNPQQQAMTQHFASPVLSRQSTGNQMQLTESQLEKAWEMPLEKLEQLVYKYGSGKGVN